MTTRRRFEEPQTHADWAHSRAQILALDAPRQIASHGPRAEFTSDHAMVAETVPKLCPPSSRWRVVEVVLRL
jgi:hypothetical protein